MGRKVTSGVAGGSGLGSINIVGNRLTSVTPDADIELAPNGTGDVVVFSDIDLLTQNDLKFFDTDSSNYVAFQAPATIAANVTWTLPAIDGTAAQLLATNGSGTLIWRDPGDIPGNLILVGAGVFNGGTINLTPVTSITLTDTRLDGFTEGAIAYSSITYTSVDGERKVTGFTETTTGRTPRAVAITYVANGTIDTFTVT